jgi:hypothetical protein
MFDQYPQGATLMFTIPLYKKAGALILCMLTILVTSPFSSAEVLGSSPIGKLATVGNVSIGGVSAPTGTAVFSGDSVSAEESPVLITFLEGSSVVLAQRAAATFSRAGKRLVVHADKGAIGFNFIPGEDVSIQAGAYQFVASSRHRANAGELAIDADGYVVMSLTSGSFSALNTASGARLEVSPASPPEPLPQQTPKGSLTKGGNTFTDPIANWTADSLKGKTITISGETHKIVSNTLMTIKIEGIWKLNTGTYGYSLGAAAAAGAAAGAGLSIGAKIALVAAFAGAGAGIGIWQATKSAK